MPKGHIYRVAAYIGQTGRKELTPRQRRRCRHKLGHNFASRGVKSVRVARPFTGRAFV